MTTPLFLLRCMELGVSVRDLDLLTIGLVIDMWTERANDQVKYDKVVYIRIIVCNFRSINFDFSKDWNRWRKLQSGNSNSDSCRFADGLGYGFSYQYTGWHPRYQQKKLDIFDFIRTGNRCVLAVLLQGFTNR